MSKLPMKVAVRRLTHDSDIFEFTISTPALRSQFRLPRQTVNQLRILIERALTGKR